MNFSLNIGLNVGDTLRHSEHAVHAALAIVFPNAEILRSHVRRSIFCELTACVALRCPETTTANLPARLHFLCTHLEQEAIAAKANGQDFLCGPGALNWNGGAFNEEAWLAVVPENNPVQCDDALWALRPAVTQREGWTIAMHEAQLSGWFERDTDGTGGGLWFERNDADQLELIGYDGTYALPLPVLDFLRTAGVDADRSFE